MGKVIINAYGLTEAPLCTYNSNKGAMENPNSIGRPNMNVSVRIVDEDMNEVIYEGTELLARAFCHEIDHLDGKMYTDLVEGELHRTSYEED